MLLERHLDVHDFLVDVSVPLRHLSDWLWRADTGHNVFALSVHKELTEEFVGSGRWVACETNTGSRIVAHVPVDHGLHVHGSSQQAADTFDLAIADRLVRHPALEDSLD